MKNKIVKMIELVLVMMVLGSSTAFASDTSISKKNNSEEAIDSVEPRSLYLASGISEITNKGNGILHIYADFTSYYSVEWAQIKITVKKSKTGETWTNAKTYTYEFKKENDPDNILIYGSADFDTDEFESGYYYRLSCTHKVKTPSGSYETKTTQTDGVLLTAYPDFRVVDQEN